MTDRHFNVRVAGKYTLVKKLGSGAFGEVFLGVCDGSGIKVAVKLVAFLPILA